MCRLEILAYDQRNGSLHESHKDFPEDYYVFFPELNQYVTRAELAVEVAVMYTMPDLVRNRRVIHFVDNSAALGACVNGYSGKADMARLVNMFHLALVALNVDWYGEWIPSEANIADLMTRPEKRGWQELKAGLEKALGEEAVRDMRRYEMKLPPLGETFAELKAWFLEVREARSCPMDRA